MIRKILAATFLIATAVHAQTNAWVPAAGLWSMAVNSDLPGGSLVSQLCSDGKVGPNQSGLNAQGQPLVKGMSCKQEPLKKDAKTLVQRVFCEFDNDGGTVDSVTRTTITGKDQYRVLNLSVVTLKGQQPTEVEVSSDMKRIAATCPADMKPGDIKMPDGKIVRDGKMYLDGKVVQY